MIASKLKRFVLSIAILTTSLMADSLFTGTSLIGIEGSYGAMNSELSDTTNPAAYTQDSTDLASIGLKIGSESENYRVFLSGRYYADMRDKYEYIATYGGELQYLFHLSEKNNIFIGASAGIMNVKFAIPAESFSRTLSDPYIGGDIGMNFHMRKFLDFELGVRILSVQAVNVRSNIKYRLNSISNAYATLIYKWKTD